jgi:hypothetical protein
MFKQMFDLWSRREAKLHVQQKVEGEGEKGKEVEADFDKIKDEVKSPR